MSVGIAFFPYHWPVTPRHGELPAGIGDVGAGFLIIPWLGVDELMG
jgi:hypothetical protein